MCLWFLVSLVGVLAMVPVHFLSLEHERLEKRLGKNRGERIGSLLGMISGWGIFIFYFGLWISPQPRFEVVDIGIKIIVPLLVVQPLEIPLVHLAAGLVFLLLGIYLGIKGVLDMGLKVAETHRPDRVISEGLYSKIRHPQYLGAVLCHLGVTFLLSSWYSFAATPLIVLVNYLLCWKEEKELVREFGEDYLNYQDSVPMFMPL